LIRLSATTLAFAALFVMFSTVAAEQPGQGGVRGQVTDSSGGVLPGVTVVAAATGGRLVATAVTDGTGRFVFSGVPAGPTTLTFQLEGFASASIAVVVQPGVESRVVQRLELAPLSETIVVRAPAVVAPPVRIVPPPPSPPPPPVVRAVPVHDRDSICGPAKPGALPESLGTIRSGRDETQGATYTTGAVLAIDGGLQDGLEVGRNLVARRYYRVRTASAAAVGEHSAGLVQIVAAAERTSVAVVVYACDELRKDDFLASFHPEPIRVSDPRGTPVYYDATRILLADEGQTLGAPRRLMVIDRGTEQGTHLGQRFTLFRQGGSAGRREVVGDAIVVAVRSDSATIRVDRVTDIVMPGDWAAPQSARSVAGRQR
jgi:carboxypeptidase family protein